MLDAAGSTSRRSTLALPLEFPHDKLHCGYPHEIYIRGIPCQIDYPSYAWIRERFLNFFRVVQGMKNIVQSF